MKKIIYALIAITLFACGQKESNIPKDITYTIIEEKSNDKLSKTTVTIRLNKKTTELVLIEIAKELRSSRKKYDKAWIFYLLPEMVVGNGCWATTHYTPNLEVKILGTTDKEDEKASKTVVTGDILNKWENNMMMMESTMYLVREDEKLLMKTVYKKDGSQGAEEIKESVKGKVTRYDYENGHREYYQIEKNGDLGMYDTEGKFNTCKKLN